MNLVELKKSLDSNDIRNLYIFSGDESAILEIYIDKVCSAVGVERKCPDNVSLVYRNLNSVSLLNKGKSLYVIREDKDFISSEEMWDTIESKLKSRNSVLILKYSSLDARSKFCKRFSDNITIFDRLSETVLKKYILKDIDISDKHCNLLIKYCGSDYSRILLEINKVRNVSESYGISDDKAFELCLKSNAFYVEPEGQVYDFVDSILSRNIKLVFENLEKSKRRSDNELLILSLLHSNVKSLLQVKVYGKANMSEISKATGLSVFQINQVSKYLDKYSCNELIRFMKYIKYCDQSVKNGLIESSNIIEYLIVNVL